MSSSEIQVGPVAPVAGSAEENLGVRAPLLPPVPRVSARTPVVSAEEVDQVPPAPASRLVEIPPVGLPKMLLGHDPLATRRNSTVVGNASAVRCQQDCLAIWRKEFQRGVLTEMDKTRLYMADQMRLAQDHSQSFSGSSWVARLEELPFALVLNLLLNERRVSASVLRWPEEEDYVRRTLKVWDEALKGPGNT
eukprot:contig_3475_g742